MAQIKRLSCDIESFSSVDLKKCGVYRYCEAADFTILLFAYSVDGGNVQVVDIANGENIPTELKAVIDIRYLAFSSRNHDVSFTKVADDRRFHPVRDYLDSLPEWDGVHRIESLLIRCLQADDTPYVRAVTRKTMAAAVGRIYRPGLKFDSVLVLDGGQGIGKSTLFKDLVGEEYYSETLSLTDMDDKSGAEKLQGFWVVEIGESPCPFPRNAPVAVYQNAQR